jgi:hypothetical protein
MARSMLPYRRERQLISQPPTPDGSMAVINVNLVTSAAFHNGGRPRGSSKSRAIESGLTLARIALGIAFPIPAPITTTHQRPPLSQRRGICGPERIASINPYGAAWSIQRPGCTGLAVGATPLAHTRARLAIRRQHRQAAGAVQPVRYQKTTSGPLWPGAGHPRAGVPWQREPLTR